MYFSYHIIIVLVYPLTHWCSDSLTVPGQVECASRWNDSNATAVSLSWQPPSRENGLTLSYHIRLVRYTSRDVVLAEVNVSSDVRSVTLFSQEQLEGGVPYIAEVVAENSVGRSSDVCESVDFYAQLGKSPLLSCALNSGHSLSS